MYGEGISKEGGLLDVGVAMDVVTKTGAWFTFGETRLGQGREASKDFLQANPDIAAEIERQIRGQDQRGRGPGRGHRRGRIGRWRGRPPRRGRRESVAERRAARGGRRPGGRPEAAAALPRGRGPARCGGPPAADPAGYRPELIDGAIDAAARARAARRRGLRPAWVESRDRAGRAASIALRRELRLRGVDRELIAATMDERRRPRRHDAFAAMDDAGDGAERGDPDEAAAAGCSSVASATSSGSRIRATARPRLRPACPERVRARDRVTVVGGVHHRDDGRRRRRTSLASGTSPIRPVDPSSRPAVR